jgi:hypothetical protein
MVPTLPPSGTPEHAQIFRYWDVSYFFATKQWTPPATIFDPTQMNARADEQQRSDTFTFEISAQRSQFCMRTSSSITANSYAWRIGDEIDEEVTLFWRQECTSLTQF